jgi:hypothetical protein
MGRYGRWYGSGEENLDGPRTPYWGCHCGCDGNWACRVRCRQCGGDAPTKVVQAAKRNAAAAKLEPKKRNDDRKGPSRDSQRDKELDKLRAEVGKLRAECNKTATDQIVEEHESESDIDIDKVQLAYNAMVNAFGAESAQAKDLNSQLESLRAARRQAKPVSVQLRTVERRVGQKQKAVVAAKLEATVAAEAVRAAQRALSEADEKVAACVHMLQEAESERKALCNRSVELTETPDVLPTRSGPFSLQEAAAKEASEEELDALQNAEAIILKLRARVADTQVVGTGQATEDDDVMDDGELVELERQSAAAKRACEFAEQRVQSAKRSMRASGNVSDRVGPY